MSMNNIYIGSIPIMVNLILF